MLNEHDVAVVIPTRGNVDMEPIVEPYIGFDFSTGYVWDNSVEEDLGVYGRFAAIVNTDAAVILTQDDDVILPPTTIRRLLDAYVPGKVVCNIPARFRKRYTDSGMVGFGAIFDRDLPAGAFWIFDDWYRSKFRVYDCPAKERFNRTCDLVFTALTPMIKVDLPYIELGYGRDESRMWRQPGHFEERDAMRKLCREVRDGT